MVAIWPRVQLLHVDWRWGLSLAVTAEDLGGPFQELRAPRRDLIGMHVILVGQIGQRLFAFKAGL